MIDILNALVLGVVLAVIIGVFGGMVNVSWATRRWVIAFLVTWSALIIAGSAFGRFTPGSPGFVIQPPVIFAGTVIAALVAWTTSPAFRRALLSIPTPALIGANVMRVLGIFFVLMYAAHRLPFPFAPFAGWGDIITGLGAIPLAIAAARGTVNAPRLAIWNAFGALDLFTALALGALSTDNSPIRIFTDAPGMNQMTQLPSVLIPTLFVPLYLLSHLTIAATLRMRSRERARSLAGSASLA